MINLTTKELDALSEQLASEQAIIAKYDSMSNLTQDATLKSKLMEIKGKHQAHYDTLFTFLR